MRDYKQDVIEDLCALRDLGVQVPFDPRALTEQQLQELADLERDGCPERDAADYLIQLALIREPIGANERRLRRGRP